MDGDNMGRTVEEALLTNDTERSQEFSGRIKAAFAEIGEFVVGAGGEIVFSGGDNLLFTVEAEAADQVAEEVRSVYVGHTDHSASVGIGSDPLSAHKALVVAKNTGKDRVVVWASDQEAVYSDIKEKQEEIEECVDQAEGDGLAPSTKYKAQAHLRRLLAIGYEPAKARHLVAESFRDLLKQKHPMRGNSDAEQYLRAGEESYQNFMGAQEAPIHSLAVSQKITTAEDLGSITYIGSRFTTVEWLKGARRERIANSRLNDLILRGEVSVIRSIRGAGRSNG